MSKPDRVSIQDGRNHYAQLCKDYGTTPTSAQTEQIMSAVGDVAPSSAKNFVCGPLYFIRRSAVVMKHGYLLVGWVHKPDGTKQEIWFRHVKSRCHVYHHDGSPSLSVYRCDSDVRLCDEWHPSIDAMCKPWQALGRHHRQMLYAMLDATIKIMVASPPPPSIEDHFPNDLRTRLSQDILIETGSDLAESDLRIESHGDEVLTWREPSNTSTTSTIETTFPGETRTKKARKSVVVDLTESDSEQSIKSELSAAPLTNNHSGHQATTSAKEELFLMLQSKKVSEIEDMLAQRSGQLPDWIERVMKEEMEKKMVRDLEVVRNLF